MNLCQVLPQCSFFLMRDLADVLCSLEVVARKNITVPARLSAYLSTVAR